MSVIARCTPAPSFSLARADGARFTQEDLRGPVTALVVYPFASARADKNTPGREGRTPVHA